MQTKLDVHNFWLNRTKGSKQAVWLESHVCLARNLDGFPFADQATSDQKNQIINQIQRTIDACPVLAKNFIKIDWNKCTEYERSLLKTICNLKNPCDETCVWLNVKENYWIVGLDGDHLLFHKNTCVWNLRSIWKKLGTLDSQFENFLCYAFNPANGYATCQPKMYGNGLEVRVTMHLPGLCFMQKIPQTKEAFKEMALTMNAQQMINSKPLGHLFDVDNATALGCSELELLSHVEQQIHCLIDMEKRARLDIWQQNRNFLKDSVGRSLGLLKNCFELNFEESMNLLSLLRMSVDLGIIDNLKPERLSALWNLMPTVSLQEFCSKDWIADNENSIRAKIVRSFFSKISNSALKKTLKEVSYAS